MKLFIIFLVFSSALAATIKDPSTCTGYPCLIFEDNFDFLDHEAWEHEVTLTGGGNWEFQAYVNNRSISYTRDSTLYIKPQLTSDWAGEPFLTSGVWNVWGSNGRGDVCTSNHNYGCERGGNPSNLLNPIMSARLRTLNDFAFRYGRIEVVAKMPRGNWLWPAIWMLPQYFRYGPWPASGEIDIVESRGNDNYGNLGNGYAGTTLHWGPYFALNRFEMTSTSYSPATGSFADAFHTWAFEWNANSMTTYLDGVIVQQINPGNSFWDYGNFAATVNIDNPWASGGKMAPFDQKFFIVINLAVGGTNGFFPDGIDPSKPWSNTSPTAYLDFWNGRNVWLPTWQDGTGKISENAALQVDSVRVYKMSAADNI